MKQFSKSQLAPHQRHHWPDNHLDEATDSSHILRFFFISLFFAQMRSGTKNKQTKKAKKKKKTLNKRSRTNRNTFENQIDEDPVSSQEKNQKDGQTDAIAQAPLGRHLSLLFLYKRDFFFFFFENADRVFPTASNTVIDRLLL